MEYLDTLVPRIPILLGCLAAIIVATLLIRRGTGTPSKLFLIGSVTLLVGTVLSTVAPKIIEENTGSASNVSTTFRMGLARFTGLFFNIAGIALIIVGFWKAATHQIKEM